VAVTLLEGDCRALLPTLPADSVHCVVTSPPYWGLRDYGTATWEGGDGACDHLNGQLVSNKSTLRRDGRAHLGPYDGEKAVTAGMPYRDSCGKCGARRIDQQLGLERTPGEYVDALVAVFRAVRRVLRDDGTLWLNMGDSYASGEIGRHDNGSPACDDWERKKDFGDRQQRRFVTGLKPKDLVGMPWRLAFALQADGWFLRADIIWAKPNPMPESVTDRPTKAHEYIFLLTKSARYFYDADAVREPLQDSSLERGYAYRDREYVAPKMDGAPTDVRANGTWHGKRYIPTGRNLRSVWTIPSAPFPLAHFATFPPALASRCIQAGSSEKGCCRACGAPWERQVERLAPSYWEQRKTHDFAGRKAATAPNDNYRSVSHGTPENSGVGYRVCQTTGWAPSCPCAAPPVPCTVLDPFAGSGTTGQVAEQLGRHSILIELSPRTSRWPRSAPPNSASSPRPRRSHLLPSDALCQSYPQGQPGHFAHESATPLTTTLLPPLSGLWSPLALGSRGRGLPVPPS
jgi:DNA modification methylase